MLHLRAVEVDQPRNTSEFGEAPLGGPRRHYSFFSIVRSSTPTQSHAWDGEINRNFKLLLVVIYRNHTFLKVFLNCESDENFFPVHFGT